MAETLSSLRTTILTRLGDTANDIWQNDEIDAYIREGYDRLCLNSGAIWEVEYLPDEAMRGNVTADWEKDYFTTSRFTELNWYAGNIVAAWEKDYLAANSYVGIFTHTGGPWEADYVASGVASTFGPANHTADWEGEYVPRSQWSTYTTGWQYTGTFVYTADGDRDFAPEGMLNLGPANHNHIWEHGSSYVSTFVGRAVHDLPSDLYDIERATWDWKRISPLRSMEMEGRDNRYELENGEVEGYLRDKDGVNQFRKWRVPSAEQSNYTVTGNHGLLRDPADASSETVDGSWGIARRVPGQHPVRGPWGFTRTVHGETRNVRIEFIRRGATLVDDDSEFELPDRYVRYIRHYAQGKALGRDGPGQDTALAGLFMGLFESCVARVVARKKAMHDNRILEIGGESRELKRPPLARMPWQYGRTAGRPPL